MRSKSIDFTGKNIYVGLDVHKKSWSAHLCYTLHFLMSEFCA